ncbi:NCS2 family permease [Neisseria sp. Ec49-e6-T10]|uniref:NCS2 family permease n=1 Tax=Neisseria sp. Ec49-e6-T10 TaxID=3140744 RepID=UPI003EB98218
MFKLKEHKTTALIEISAGITTFCAMVYVLAVNPAILSNAGVPKEALFTATALAAIIGTLAMAFIANLPFAVAPGMGINAFFAFVVVLHMGYSWPQAITAVLLASIIFLLLSLSPLREKVLADIPVSLQYAVCGGLGIMIAGIGLIQAKVIDLSTGLPALGDFHQKEVQLVLIGILITAILLAMRFRYALLAGIICSTLIGIPLKVTNIDFIYQNQLFSMPPSISSIAFHFDFSLVKSFDFLSVVFVFVFIALVDSLAGFLGLFSVMGNDGAKYRPKMGKAFIADSFSAITSSFLGVSPNTVYGESGTGVAVGGRTGLTSVVTALCFGLALFCAPIFLAIPFAAVAPALIVVGWYMLAPITKIKFDDPTESFPAIIAIVFIGLTWKISDSLALAWVVYILMKIVTLRIKELNITVCLVGCIFILKLLWSIIG